MNTYAKTSDTYLVQRIMSAGPEQQAALLMEAGQRHIGKALLAMERKDFAAMAQSLIRVTEIINESVSRLNYDNGGELVENLLKVYDWWTAEVFTASKSRDVARLKAVSDQMGEIGRSWEQLYEKMLKNSQASEFQLGNRVV